MCALYLAGVGEACSHIGATLFALETSIMLLKNTACTSMPCEWIRPSAQKIGYAEGANLSNVSVRGASSTKSDASPPAVKEPRGVRLQPHLFHLRPVRQQDSTRRLQPVVHGAVSCRWFHHTAKPTFRVQSHISYRMLCSTTTMC